MIEQENKYYSEIILGCFFWVVLLFTYWLYSHSLTASLQFDDQANLNGLSTIHNFSTAIDFIFEGIAGPLGRPIALSTFTIQYYAWPDHPEIFLKWNILIHLINGSLVTWLALSLSKIQQPLQTTRTMVAVITGSTFLLLPLLVSSSLFIIQRMTILSATFVFSGLIFYTKVRIKSLSNPDKHLLKLGLITVLFTTLAAFTKENGALLPIYILIIEITFFSSKTYSCNHIHWKIWKAIFLFIPLIAILVFVVKRAHYSETTILIRGFTSAERIAAQGYILWQYLLNAFITSPSKLGPFHDTVWNFNRETLLTGWFLYSVILIIVICAIYYRKRNKLLSFAILWYFAGHILESSTLSLEFYFEHRNYTPMIGPIFSLVAYLFSIKKQKNIIKASIVAYLIIISTITYQTTTLWGQKLIAAKMWSIENPDSTRATLHLAKQLEESRFPREALKVLRRFNNKHDFSLGLQIHELILSCALNPTLDHAEHLIKIQKNSPEARYEGWASESPENLHSFLLKHTCKNIDFNSVRIIADQMIQNKRYQANRKSIHQLYALKALLDLQYDEPRNALKNFDIALTKHVSPELLYLALWVAKLQNDSDFIKKWDENYKHNP